MPDWLGIVLVLLGIAAVFWLTFRLLRRSQDGDASKRGEDSSEPGGFYSDNYSGNPD